MNRRLGTVLLVAPLALALVAARAGAEPTSVVVVPTGEEPTCAPPHALVAALERHAPWPARAASEPPPDAAIVRVRLAGERIAVELTIDGWRAEEVLDAPPCDVTSEVVAARVASMLTSGPTPDAAPPLPSAEVIADEAMAALGGAGVELSGDAVLTPVSGGWSVALVGDRCRREQFVGSLPGSRQLRIARVSAAVASLIASCRREQIPSLDRAVAAAQTIDANLEGAWLRRSGGLILAGVGAAAVGLWGVSISDGNELGWEDRLYLAGAAVAIGGGLLGWARRDHDDGDTIVYASAGVGAGIAAMGLAFELPQHDTVGDDGLYEEWIVVGAAQLVSSGWFVIDRLRTPAIGARRLAELRRRVETPEKRARLSPRELDEIERQLRRWDAPGPAWYHTLPLYAGAGLALSLALDHEQVDEREKGLIAAVALFADALLHTMIHSSRTSHGERLRALGLDVGVAPVRGGGAAVGVSGRF